MARVRNRGKRCSTDRTVTAAGEFRTEARKDDIMGNRFDDLPLFLTPLELAQVTGEHVNSIRRGILEGRIPADKVNGRWRICRDAVFANAKMGLLEGGKAES